MTGFCQPAGFGWFAQLKNRLVVLADEWKKHGPHELTRGGNVRPPNAAVVSHWLTESWSVVDCASIHASFIRCALGSDDELHLSRHERLGPKFVRATQTTATSTNPLLLQHLLDEFDDLAAVDE